MSGDVAVYVVVGERNLLAGRLYPHRRRGVESASFVYDDRYLADPDAYALDPALPLVTGALQTPVGRALFGAFSDCAPDRWGRTLITRAEMARAKLTRTAPRSLSEADVLLGVRDDLRQGAMRFRVGEDGPFLAAEDSGIPILTDLPALLDIAERAESDTAGYAELNRLLRAGSSLGGARPKAHVMDSDGRIAIAKFPSAGSDTWNVMAWEKVALDLACDAGISVPDSRLIRVGDRSVLIVDRFDRQGAARIGYASAMTMLEASDGDQRSYLEIAEVIEERSTTVTADLHQLWRRICFSILISNTDDHLRNHGFLHERAESWVLSPAFDLNPNPEPGPKELSTAIDFYDYRASIDTLMGVAENFRLNVREAADVLAHVSSAVGRWRASAALHGLRPAEIEAMEPAFEHAEQDRAQAIAKNRHELQRVAGGVPDREDEGAHEEREDDPVLAEFGCGDLERARQQVELVHAERPEDRAAAMRELVAGDVCGGAQADAEGEQGYVPVRHGDHGQVGARVAGDDGGADAEQVAVVAADVEGAERGGVQQCEVEGGGDHVPGEGGMADGTAGQLVPARGHRAGCEDRDADQAVRAVPVAAGDPVHDPGERPGQKAEAPGDRAVRVIDVGQHAGPRADRHRCDQVRAGDVQ